MPVRCREHDTLKKKLVDDLGLLIQQLHTKHVSEQALTNEWSTLIRGLPCLTQTRAAACSRTYIDKLRDSWQHLLRDRAATRGLTYNNEQFHVLERIKIGEVGRTLKALLETEVVPSMTQLSESLADWYKMAQTVYLKARILDKDVDAFHGRLDSFIDVVMENDISFHRGLQTVSRVQGAGRVRNQELRSLRTSIKDILSVQQEISATVWENNELISQFDALTAPLRDLEEGE